MNEKDLMNKTIASIEIDGFGVNLITQDGVALSYNASDGGYSCWDIFKEGDDAE